MESRKIAQQDVADGKEHRDAVMAKLLASRANVLQKEDRDRTKFENWLEETYSRGGPWTEIVMMNDTIDSLKGLSKTKTVNALKAQILVRLKVPKCEQQRKVILGKCSVEELQGLMAETMSIAVPEELDDLYELMLDPRRMVGSQRWNQDDTMKWYSGQIVSCDVTTKGLLDFKVTYNDNSICYMAPEEIIVDILRGDLELFSN